MAAKLTSREKRQAARITALEASLNRIRAWSVGTAVGVVNSDKTMLSLIAKEADDALQGVSVK